MASVMKVDQSKVDERISIKKEQISSYLVYNIVSLGRMAGKTEPFSWRSVEDELAVKYEI